MIKSEKSGHLNACRELAYTVRDFRRRSRVSARELHARVGEFYTDHGLGLLEGFTRLRDVKFIFPAGALAQIRPQMVGKKAALYSGASLCILPSRFHLSRQKLDAAEFFCDFVEANHALISRGRLIPFPVMDTRPLYKDNLSRWYQYEGITAINKKLDDGRIDSFAQKSDALPVFGTQESLVRQLNEDDYEETYVPVGAKQLLLPTLDGIDQETLVKVLEDNENPSLKFRGALQEALKGVSGADSDRRLLEAMERVDNEVRDLSDKMKLISGSRARAGVATSVGILATGLSLVAPDWLSQAASAALGSVTALDGFRTLGKIADESASTKASEFYLPWLLSSKFGAK